MAGHMTAVHTLKDNTDAMAADARVRREAAHGSLEVPHGSLEVAHGSLEAAHGSLEVAHETNQTEADHGSLEVASAELTADAAGQWVVVDLSAEATASAGYHQKLQAAFWLSSLMVCSDLGPGLVLPFLTFISAVESPQ